MPVACPCDYPLKKMHLTHSFAYKAQASTDTHSHANISEQLRPCSHETYSQVSECCLVHTIGNRLTLLYYMVTCKLLARKNFYACELHETTTQRTSVFCMGSTVHRTCTYTRTTKVHMYMPIQTESVSK